MYRIELRPGEEALYKTFEEFATAVHTGTVTSHSRIWHNAQNKWLPIDFHPHFKRAAAETPAEPKPAPAKKSRELLFLNTNEIEAPRAAAPDSAARPNFANPEPATPRHIEALLGAAEQLPPAVAEPAEEDEAAEVLIDLGAPRMPIFTRRNLAIAAGLGVLVLGGWMFASRTPTPAQEPADLTVASTTLGASPRTSFELEASVPASSPGQGDTGAGPVNPVGFNSTMELAGGPLENVAPARDSSLRVLPQAPQLKRVANLEQEALSASSEMTSAVLIARYQGAYQRATQDLQRKLRGSGLTNLFATSRLSFDQLPELRLAVAGAANYARAYRANDERIDAAYRDTAMQLSGDWNAAERAAWEKASTLSESPTALAAADRLLADMAAMLGILESEAGRISLESGRVKFQDQSAAVQYDALRDRVMSTLAKPDAENPVTAAVKSTLGSARPPVGR